MRSVSNIARERFEADRRVKEAAARETPRRITHAQELALYASLNRCNRRARRNARFLTDWLIMHENDLRNPPLVIFSTEYRPTEWPAITEEA